MEIRYFNTLESTNNYCKLLNLDEVEEFLVVCAGKQTAGIGQQGNVWVSEPYKNLTFSIILKPTFISAADQYQLTMTFAVAVADAVTELLPNEKTYIKWPNDIYVGDRKICGILASNQIKQDFVALTICGIGLNVNQTLFPDCVPNPVSLKMADGQERDTDSVLHLVLDKLQKRYKELHSGINNIEEQYLSLLYRRGIEASYQYKGHNILGTILGINQFGHLILQCSDGKTICSSMKEIKFLI